jgi:heat shock protein HslJ
MRATRLTRRGVLALGAATMAAGLLGSRTAAGAPSEQTQAPAQVPRAPTEGASTGQAAPGLTQGLWRWLRTEYSDDSVVTAADPSRYTIALQSDGRLSVQADCNRGSGRYTLDGAALTLDPGAMTLAACPPGTQDFVFLRDLRNVATYVFDGEHLVLNLRLDGGNMVFEAQPPATLTGVAWRVQSYNNGRGGVVTVLAGTQLNATFGEDGSVSGNTGCNAFRGPYTLAGSSLRFGGLVTTRRACLSDEATAQEQAFLAALGNVTAYELVGDRLTLRDGGGATQAVLLRPTN